MYKENTVFYTTFIKQGYDSPQTPHESVLEVLVSRIVLLLLSNSLLILSGHYQLELYAFLSLLATKKLNRGQASKKVKDKCSSCTLLIPGSVLLLRPLLHLSPLLLIGL